jgi:hypothetical protein
MADDGGSAISYGKKSDECSPLNPEGGTLEGVTLDELLQVMDRAAGNLAKLDAVRLANQAASRDGVRFTPDSRNA